MRLSHVVLGPGTGRHCMECNVVQPADTTHNLPHLAPCCHLQCTTTSQAPMQLHKQTRGLQLQPAGGESRRASTLRAAMGNSSSSGRTSGSSSSSSRYQAPLISSDPEAQASRHVQVRVGRRFPHCDVCVPLGVRAGMRWGPQQNLQRTSRTCEVRGFGTHRARKHYTNMCAHIGRLRVLRDCRGQPVARHTRGVQGV